MSGETDPFRINAGTPPTPPTSDDAADTRRVMDALNQQDRILTEARMLPKETPLTDQHVADVRRAFAGRLQASNLTLGKVSDQIGYSVPVLSEFMSGKYGGDVEKVTRAVNNWLGRESRRAATSAKRIYVKTRVAEEMRSIINLADSMNMMCVVVGPSGCGKTLVLEALREELNAVYIPLEDRMAPHAFLRRLGTHLGISLKTKQTKDRAHVQCVEILRSTKQVVMIDEAQNLRPETLSAVRALHDQAGVTIVMAGSAEFLDHVDDRADGRGQFSSRCITLNLLDDVRDVNTPTGDRGGTNLFSVEEVKAFFHNRQIRIDRDALEMLWALACLPGWGSLRVLDRIAMVAAGNAALSTKVLTRADVRAILKVLMRGVLPAIDKLVVKQTRPADREALTA